MKKLLYIVIFPLAGFCGSFFVMQSIDTWYAMLAKPSFTPPDYLFGPIWTILYAIMGYYFAKILELPSGQYKKKLLTIFILQFILNMMWTPVFFGMQNILAGLFVIDLLFLCVSYMLFLGLKNLRRPTILMFPYLLWLGFASALNLGIFLLN